MPGVALPPALTKGPKPNRPDSWRDTIPALVVASFVGEWCTATRAGQR